jgi:hypothetical protein
MKLSALFACAAIALAIVPAHATAQLTSRAPLAFGPSGAGDTAKYTVEVDFKLSTDQTARPPTTQLVTFTMIDGSHVRMSTGEGADAETAVADRLSDGRLRIKLKRGSLLYWPMQIFNKLASLTAVASDTGAGEVRSGAIPLAESDDAIPGSLRVERPTGSSTDVSVEAAGPATPRELPKGANSGRPLVQPTSGNSLTGGSDQGSKAPVGQAAGDATVHLRATYVDGPLVHAESMEQIVIAGTPAITIQRHWSISKT